MNYLTNILPPHPAVAPLPGQVPNSAGGHAWAVDDWTRLAASWSSAREGGSYYAARARAHARERRGRRALHRAPTARARSPRSSRVSRGGRAPKNDPALFALAMAAGARRRARRAARRSTRCRDVCRTGTHLFHFARFVEGFRGWGRGLRARSARWYARAHAGRARLPGRQVPPARRLVAPRPPAPGAPGAAASAGNPALDVSRTARRGCSSGSSAAATRPDCPRLIEGFERAQARETRRARRPRSSASTACRARRSRREHLTRAGGLGGAARATCR